MNKSLLLVPMGLSALGAQAKAKPAAGCDKPLNIIYIMTDDHSFQTISCYDGRYNNTPNLDRLAREGVRFDNSFVANSISGPSRAVLVTGKHSHKNGFMRNDGKPVKDLCDFMALDPDQWEIARPYTNPFYKLLTYGE